MPAKTNFAVRAAILMGHQNGLSCQKIKEQLSGMGMTASKSTVNRVIVEYQLQQQGVVKPAKRLGTQCTRSIRSPATIKKVKNLVHRADPFTTTQIQRQLGLSRGTLWRIIHRDLAAESRKKRKTHMLSDRQVAQRVEKVPRLLKHLRGGKWRFIVSIDEAWCYMTNVNGRRRMFYKFRGEASPQSWLKYCRQKHPLGLMFVAGISALGTTAIRFVPPRTKVNSDFYVKRVLQPLFEKDIPRLYGKDAKSVALHHDSAPAHKALGTVRFLEDNNYRFIPAADWPSNSPDLSPMDYSINGIFKRRLWKHKTHTLAGLKRAMRQEWSKIDVDLCVELSSLGKNERVWFRRITACR
jgi:hypothetical protein